MVNFVSEHVHLSCFEYTGVFLTEHNGSLKYSVLGIIVASLSICLRYLFVHE